VEQAGRSLKQVEIVRRPSIALTNRATRLLPGSVLLNQRVVDVIEP
jgi:hypothetical protein